MSRQCGSCNVWKFLKQSCLHYSYAQLQLCSTTAMQYKLLHPTSANKCFCALLNSADIASAKSYNRKHRLPVFKPQRLNVARMSCACPRPVLSSVFERYSSIPVGCPVALTYLRSTQKGLVSDITEYMPEHLFSGTFIIHQTSHLMGIKPFLIYNRQVTNDRFTPLNCWWDVVYDWLTW